MIMIPTVHMNGDSFAELERVHDELADALQAAQKALQEAAPNARNFYVQGDDAYTAARKEHVARTAALGKLVGEIDGIRIGIADQRRTR